MNCQEVQIQLSGYLEKSLDTIRMKGVEAHLASCPFCRAEARGLSDCIALVQALPAVEPPPGFAQRVMAYAREIEIEVPLWKRLFGILPTTVPIQATAVLLVGVLAVLVYQREPKFRDTSITESSPPPAALRSDPERNTEPAGQSAKDASSDRAGGHESTVRAQTPAAQSSDSKKKLETDLHAGQQTLPPAAPEIREQKPLEFPLAPRRAPIQAQKVSTGPESIRSSPDAFAFGTSIAQLNRQPFGVTPFAAGRALSPLSEPSADFEFIVRRRGLERRETAEAVSGDLPRKRSESDAAIAAAAAQRAVPAPAAAASSIVEIRWFTVAPHYLEDFRRELAAEANIDSERGPAQPENDSSTRSSRDFLIKVVILPSER